MWTWGDRLFKNKNLGFWTNISNIKKQKSWRHKRDDPKNQLSRMSLHLCLLPARGRAVALTSAITARSLWWQTVPLIGGGQKPFSCGSHETREQHKGSSCNRFNSPRKQNRHLPIKMHGVKTHKWKSTAPERKLCRINSLACNTCNRWDYSVERSNRAAAGLYPVHTPRHFLFHSRCMLFFTTHGSYTKISTHEAKGWAATNRRDWNNLQYVI